MDDRLLFSLDDDAFTEIGMRLLLNSKKPSLVSSESLCSFRTSKAYLWGLVHDRLDQRQKESETPLLILDAACHALITRSMFPKRSRYYGLDISRQRLMASVDRLSLEDTLYWADLTKSLPLKRCFDVVVSCNTLSHLPLEQQPLAIENLIAACRPAGDLLINTSIDSGLLLLATSLLNNFQLVEPIYFDSLLSRADEEKNLINSCNVASKMLLNEQRLPNDACLHQQVLFHARGCLRKGKNQVPPLGLKNKFVQLNDVLEVDIRLFRDDLCLLQDDILLSKSCLVLFSSKLYKHEYGFRLRQKIEALGLDVIILDYGSNMLSIDRYVVILGLEHEWCSSIAQERLFVNQLRKVASKITFALVRQRVGMSCQPSLVAQDS